LDINKLNIKLLCVHVCSAYTVTLLPEMC